MGDDWSKQILVPNLTRTTQDKNYLNRTTTLYAVKALIPVYSPEDIERHLLPLVMSLQRDPVPNIRFNTAKTLGLLAPRLSPDALKTKVKPALDILA